MKTDLASPWLTTADVQRVLQLDDPRAARRVMRELGAARIGGQYRLPPDALDALRPVPKRINGEAKQDQRPAHRLRSAPECTRDPSAQPNALEPGWWKQDQP